MPPRRGSGVILADLLDRVLREELVGHDPLQRGWLWHRMWELDRTEELPLYLLGLVDTALRDLAGRLADRPTWQIRAATSPSRTGGLWRRSWCCSRMTRLEVRSRTPAGLFIRSIGSSRIQRLGGLILRLECATSRDHGISVDPLDRLCTEAP